MGREPVRTQTGFFSGSLPTWIILGSFLFITLPLSGLWLVNKDLLYESRGVLLYLVGLGVTHFVLTLTIYFQSTNLKHFNSSWGNRAKYFLAPAGILLFFFVYYGLRVSEALPVFGILFFWLIRFFDFHHFCRQNFGVLQLFKGRSRGQFPVWLRRAENFYFYGLMALLMLTFLPKPVRIVAEGEGSFAFDGTRWEARIGLAVVTVLLGSVLVGYGLAWKRSKNRRALLTPFAYLLLQSASAALAIYATPLYIFSLAMHYVEYHVLMVPRCFHTQLNSQKRTDWLFGFLRKNRIIFYLALLAVAGVLALPTWMAMGAMMAYLNESPSISMAMMLAILNSLFVFHYFIEAFIWKFSDPFYRQQLGPLYFGAKSASR